MQNPCMAFFFFLSEILSSRRQKLNQKQKRILTASQFLISILDWVKNMCSREQITLHGILTWCVHAQQVKSTAWFRQLTIIWWHKKKTSNFPHNHPINPTFFSNKSLDREQLDVTKVSSWNSRGLKWQWSYKLRRPSPSNLPRLFK